MFLPESRAEISCRLPQRDHHVGMRYGRPFGEPTNSLRLPGQGIPVRLPFWRREQRFLYSQGLQFDDFQEQPDELLVAQQYHQSYI